jgi:hypothetical protein
MGPIKLHQTVPVQEPGTLAPEHRISQPHALPSDRSKPVLPPGIPEYFVPVRSAEPKGSGLFYEPTLLGIGTVYYSHAKAGIASETSLSLLADFAEQTSRIDWDEAQRMDITEDDVEKFADDKAAFGEIPGQASQKKNYKAWSKDFKAWLYRNQRLELLKSPSLLMVSKPGESERDFRVRLQLAAREKRDMLVERLRKQYASKITKLQERIRRAELTVEKEKEQAKQEKLKTAISFGATIFSALLGRKKISHSSLGRAATTARRAGRILKEGRDIDRAKGNVQDLHNKLSELQARLSEETEEIRTSIDPLNENLDTFVLKPKKMDIAISLVSLAWIPYWQDDKGGITPAWH